MPYGTLNAFNDLNAFYVEVAGATGPPVLTMANPSPGSTFSGSTVVQLHVQFPGSDAPTKGLGVVLSVSGGTFNSSGGPSTIGVATDSGGNVSVALFAPNPGAVTVDAVAAVGQVGVGFYHSSNAGPRTWPPWRRRSLCSRCSR